MLSKTSIPKMNDADEEMTSYFFKRIDEIYEKNGMSFALTDGGVLKTPEYILHFADKCVWLTDEGERIGIQKKHIKSMGIDVYNFLNPVFYTFASREAQTLNAIIYPKYLEYPEDLEDPVSQNGEETASNEIIPNPNVGNICCIEADYTHDEETQTKNGNIRLAETHELKPTVRIIPCINAKPSTLNEETQPKCMKCHLPKAASTCGETQTSNGIPATTSEETQTSNENVCPTEAPEPDLIECELGNVSQNEEKAAPSSFTSERFNGKAYKLNSNVLKLFDVKLLLGNDNIKLVNATSLKDKLNSSNAARNVNSSIPNKVVKPRRLHNRARNHRIQDRKVEKNLPKVTYTKRNVRWASMEQQTIEQPKMAEVRSEALFGHRVELELVAKTSKIRLMLYGILIFFLIMIAFTVSIQMPMLFKWSCYLLLPVIFIIEIFSSVFEYFL